jgi:hypothetical protein
MHHPAALFAHALDGSVFDGNRVAVDGICRDGKARDSQEICASVVLFKAKVQTTLIYILLGPSVDLALTVVQRMKVSASPTVQEMLSSASFAAQVPGTQP